MAPARGRKLAMPVDVLTEVVITRQRTEVAAFARASAS
jgi:hypothetical protein